MRNNIDTIQDLRAFDCPNDLHIRTYNDVVSFVQYLVNVQNISFHPDDDFADYLDANQETISAYNRINEECFAVCENASIDIYQVHYQVQYEHLNKYLNKC